MMSYDKRLECMMAVNVSIVFFFFFALVYYPPL